MNLGLLVAPILLVAAVLYVSWPLLRETPEVADESADTGFEALVEAKNHAVDNLKDIEMDRRMGKLSDEDYQSLKAEFEARALEAIEKLESYRKRRPRGKA